MTRLHQQFPLRRGSHESRDRGMCTMEMVAWLGGEEHSDEPACACPTLAAYVRALNDALPTDAWRERLLRPLAPSFVNTRGSAADEARRGFLVLDHAVRVMLPLVLRASRRPQAAAALADLAPVRDLGGARAALGAVTLWAGEQRAVRWLLQRAAEGLPPARYVGAAVTLARSVGDDEAWTRAAALAMELAQAAPVAQGLSQG